MRSHISVSSPLVITSVLTRSDSSKPTTGNSRARYAASIVEPSESTLTKPPHGGARSRDRSQPGVKECSPAERDRRPLGDISNVLRKSINSPSRSPAAVSPTHTKNVRTRPTPLTKPTRDYHHVQDLSEDQNKENERMHPFSLLPLLRRCGLPILRRNELAALQGKDEGRRAETQEGHIVRKASKRRKRLIQTRGDVCPLGPVVDNSCSPSYKIA